MQYDVHPSGPREIEQQLLKRMRVWIIALAVVCVGSGMFIGALLAGHPAIAQNDAQGACAPEALSASFAEIARRVEPAVVNIDTVSALDIAMRDTDEEDGEQNAPPSGNPFSDMFRRRRPPTTRGVGSGFIVDPKGYILTNQHVVEGATRIIVQLQTGEKLRGEIIGMDEDTDLAVIKVNAGRDLPTVKFGNSDEVQVGDWVLAIGSPFGLDQTVTAGIISTKDRQTRGASNFQRFIQTDAAINRGNSGGPLVNMRGEVIGVNSQIATTTGDYNGIGFALPSNTAAFVYHQIVAQGRVRRGYLGVFLESVQREYAQVYGLPEARGAIITELSEEPSPASRAGLQHGDIIIEFNGQPVTNAQDLINKVAATPVGQTVNIAYLREVNGKFERRTTSVAVGERPSRKAARHRAASGERARPRRNDERPRLGLTLSELTPQIIAERNLRGARGLLITEVEPDSLADDANLLKGWVIQRVNRTSVNTLADFERIVNALKPGDPVVMIVISYEGGRANQRIVQFTYQ